MASVIKTPPDPTKFGGAAKAREQKRKQRQKAEEVKERDDRYRKDFGSDPDFASEASLALLAAIEEEMEAEKSDSKPDKDDKSKKDKPDDKSDDDSSSKDPKARKKAKEAAENVGDIEDRVAVVEAGLGAVVRHAESPGGRLGKPAKLDLKDDLKKGNLPKGVSVADAAKQLRKM